MQDVVKGEMNMKIIILLMFPVLNIASFDAEETHVYLCRKYDISVIKANRPNTLYCSAEDSHNWNKF
jgi:hypothetical protein